MLGDQPDLDEQARHRGSFDERNQRHGLVGLPDSDPIPNAAAASYGLLEQVGADLPRRQDEPAFADEQPGAPTLLPFNRPSSGKTVDDAEDGEAGVDEKAQVLTRSQKDKRQGDHSDFMRGRKTEEDGSQRFAKSGK